MGIENNLLILPSNFKCEILLIVDSKIISKGKAKGLYAGYNSKEKEPYVSYMIEEALKHQPIKCNESEMKLLELIIKQNR